MPVPVSRSPPDSSSERAIPKSATSGVAAASARGEMFSGLMSRWTMPCECAYASAVGSSRAMRIASPSGSCCSRSRRSRSDSPVDEGHHVEEKSRRFPRIDAAAGCAGAAAAPSIWISREETLGAEPGASSGCRTLIATGRSCLRSSREIHGRHAAAPQLALDPIPAGERCREKRGGDWCCGLVASSYR